MGATKKDINELLNLSPTHRIEMRKRSAIPKVGSKKITTEDPKRKTKERIKRTVLNLSSLPSLKFITVVSFCFLNATRAELSEKKLFKESRMVFTSQWRIFNRPIQEILNMMTSIVHDSAPKNVFSQP